MTAELAVALLSLLGSALGTLGGVFLNARLTTYRIEQLEKKVDKHNNVIERTYKLEQQAAVQAEDLKAVDRRLAGLERRGG